VFITCFHQHNIIKLLILFARKSRYYIRQFKLLVDFQNVCFAPTLIPKNTVPISVHLTLLIMTYHQAVHRSRSCPCWRFLARNWRAPWMNRPTLWVWRVSEAFQTWLSVACSAQVTWLAAASTWRSTWNCVRCIRSSPHDLHSYLAANTDR